MSRVVLIGARAANRLKFTPDGKQFVACASDKNVTVFSA